MKQIKTIITKADRFNIFDEYVNEAIRDGWELKRREFIWDSANSYNVLYAELERE